MRYCIISDIHANLEAFKAVLDEAGRSRIDGYLCLGDIVGYGADPDACMETVRSLNAEVLIAGNHDWGVLGLLDLGYFNDFAKEAIIWTKSVLSRQWLEFLRSFSLTCESGSFSMTHGSLHRPEEFNYILNAAGARDSMALMKTDICFVGHTHAAGIFYTNNKNVEYSTQAEIKIEQGQKYIVNVGSIGQPRDGDARASYVVYDTANRLIEIRRVRYDINSAAKKILEAGLPSVLAERLYKGI